MPIVIEGAVPMSSPSESLIVTDVDDEHAKSWQLMTTRSPPGVPAVMMGNPDKRSAISLPVDTTPFSVADGGDATR